MRPTAVPGSELTPPGYLGHGNCATLFTPFLRQLIVRKTIQNIIESNETWGNCSSIKYETRNCEWTESDIILVAISSNSRSMSRRVSLAGFESTRRSLAEGFYTRDSRSRKLGWRQRATPRRGFLVMLVLDASYQPTTKRRRIVISNYTYTHITCALMPHTEAIRSAFTYSRNDTNQSASPLVHGRTRQNRLRTSNNEGPSEFRKSVCACVYLSSGITAYIIIIIPLPPRALQLLYIEACMREHGASKRGETIGFL